MPETIDIIKFTDFRWYNITDNSDTEIQYLRENFEFTEADLESSQPPLQRPKIIKNPNYIFMILLFPYYDHDTHEVKISEIDFFLAPGYLITMSDGKLDHLSELFTKYSDSHDTSNDFGTPLVNLLYEIIDGQQSACFPMLNHVGLDIDEVEDRIFMNHEKGTIRDILLIKRNIVNFRKAMQAHKNVLKKLLLFSANVFETRHITMYFQNLIEQTKDIWDLLENYNETIKALHHTNESLSTFQLNQTMKTLTIFSMVIFSLTLLAAIFSMGVEGIPFTDHPDGFWIIMMLMFAGSIMLLSFFKLRRWL